jgi:hypothetical protein
MQKIIVSDTSCLILLDKLGRLDLLKTLFGNVTITQIIADEFGNSLPEFIIIENPKDKNYQKILEGYLDPGESSAIALALEKDDCLHPFAVNFFLYKYIYIFVHHTRHLNPYGTTKISSICLLCFGMYLRG